MGQSEIEIAGLADATVVVLVPEAGDEVQTMKAGLMEIADIFVVNKADRPDADLFVRNLMMMLAPAFNKAHTIVPVIKTIASRKEGIAALYQAIESHIVPGRVNEKRLWLLAEKAYLLIIQKRMKNVSKSEIKKQVALEGNDFNLYRFIQNYPA